MDRASERTLSRISLALSAIAAAIGFGYFWLQGSIGNGIVIAAIFLGFGLWDYRRRGRIGELYESPENSAGESEPDDRLERSDRRERNDRHDR